MAKFAIFQNIPVFIQMIRLLFNQFIQVWYQNEEDTYLLPMICFFICLMWKHFWEKLYFRSVKKLFCWLYILVYMKTESILVDLSTRKEWIWGSDIKSYISLHLYSDLHKYKTAVWTSLNFVSKSVGYIKVFHLIYLKVFQIDMPKGLSNWYA